MRSLRQPSDRPPSASQAHSQPPPPPLNHDLTSYHHDPTNRTTILKQQLKLSMIHNIAVALLLSVGLVLACYSIKFIIYETQRFAGYNYCVDAVTLFNGWEFQYVCSRCQEGYGWIDTKGQCLPT